MVGGEAIKGTKDLVSLWVHETSRVFQDRLTDQKDVEWYSGILEEGLKTHFKTKLKDIYSDINQEDKADRGKQKLLIYSDFGDNKGKKMYKQVMGITKYRAIVENQLEDYNSMTTSGKMN
eukprot:CAMPEP_0184482648 /NCGR_PEP_ID=MMETSP0113_2-20130426/4227_1 /TAXON_ID=91329 /ORGANISM="Norrisiella sphaerica, Strain BC52" /LENGTH=119 /DNA_ID=CAMNT_0026862511 /DNA_START=201 /DNA_END=557 /DNA_ORIENTATION=-